MRDGGNEMTGKREREVSSRAGNEAGREERRERRKGERGRKEGWRKEGAICMSVSTW